MPTRQLHSLFPTPCAQIEGLLEPHLVEALRERALQSQRQENSAGNSLSHTEVIDPSGDSLFTDIAALAVPEITRFGEVLFGERLNWLVKEMWLNVLEHGGSQFMHSHANSFVSAVLFVTEAHESARTLFLRRMGGDDFRFRNDSESARLNAYNSDKWAVPRAMPGDMLIYPSYLIHGVPPNEGGQRITVALNAIPDQLNSQGYRIRFAPP
jgi:uncharacterized protein (TIGR02466 family)